MTANDHDQEPGHHERDPGLVDPTKQLVVGIGASAGGIEALQTFFGALPEQTGAAFVVVIHLDPQRRSELASILESRTRMPVSQVGVTQTLRANHVYVIPPDRRLQITDDEISAAAFDEPHGRRTPIDLFFRSVAERHGDGFAIILTGAGSDGAIGVRAVKEAGGIILVQDPDEAEYPSMPRSAIATGVADFVLPVHELVARLVELIQNRKHVFADAYQASDALLVRILANLRVRTGHDFSGYRRTTVLRRIARRMEVTRTKDLSGYHEFLRNHAEESQALLADLLISVTTFFRDAETFDALKVQVIPQLFRAKEPTEPIRVWVPGCATGEEAYSIAMLLMEEAARQESPRSMQLFGSDLDTRALPTAREGRFPVAIEVDVSEERLRRFFVRDGDHYRARQELRDIILFASHDLLKDPPFSRIDLISCRNLLIYLDRQLQDQVCGIFHYALNPGGFLLLGSSETAQHSAGLFRTVDHKAHIYQSTAQADKPRLLAHLLGRPAGHESFGSAGALLETRGKGNEPAFHAKALEQGAPPSMLVDQNHRVLHLSEHAGRYLQPSAGRMSIDVSTLVRPELRSELRAALNRLFEQGRSTLSLPIPVQFNGAPHPVQMWIKPGREHEGAPALVMFIEGEAIDPSVISADQRRDADDTVRQLKLELEIAHGRLQTMRKESETATEGLRAANEELQSVNEEYRSTTEELETSKEEVQSINEELQTVNSELKHKLEAGTRANSDLQNVMTSIDFGMLFIDAQLRIKRFTKHVTDLFSITAADEGRQITDFAHRLEYGDLVKDARSVLSNLTPVRREIHSRNDRWYDIQLRPYRTIDDKIDGVVMTFVDVTDLKRLERRQQVLLSELTHRVKNILAVVQAMAHQTERHGSPSEFVERFGGRLLALASTHDLLVQSDWKGADLASLARQQLCPYTTAESKNRVRIEGEPVSLSPDIATPFGLVLHELAVNAFKHGSLAGSRGSVDLSWTANSQNGERVLRFIWQEQGGVVAPRSTKRGMGSWLIEHAIPNASVHKEFEPQGLTCTIEVLLQAEKPGAVVSS
jgi:two-component system, chemotaxis family, CheB/CheR fusion protein